MLKKLLSHKRSSARIISLIAEETSEIPIFSDN